MHFEWVSFLRRWGSWKIKQKDKKIFYWGFVWECNTIAVHYSGIKYFLNNRDSIFTIDIKNNLPITENRHSDGPFDMEMLDLVLISSVTIQDEIHGKASESIEKRRKHRNKLRQLTLVFYYGYFFWWRHVFENW